MCDDETVADGKSENGTTTRSGASSRIATPSGSQCSARTSVPSEIEKDYLEDEAWHQKMVEYLAQARDLRTKTVRTGPKIMLKISVQLGSISLRT